MALTCPLQPPVALSLHPDGFQLLVGFRKHLALFHILLNALHVSHTLLLPVPMNAVLPTYHSTGGSGTSAQQQQRLLIRYSNGGSKVAVGIGLNVFVYHAVNLQLIQHVSEGGG